MPAPGWDVLYCGVIVLSLLSKPIIAMKSCFKVAVYLLAGLFVFSCNEETPDVPETIVSVETIGTKDVQSHSVILCGSVSSASSFSANDVGFIFTTEFPSLEKGSRLMAAGIDKDGVFTVEVDGLEMCEQYNYRAFVIDKGEYRLGDIKFFSTPFQREAVDLGLSVKWANADMGAMNMYDFRDTYAWGETEPKNMPVGEVDITWYYKTLLAINGGILSYMNPCRAFTPIKS